LSDLFSTNGDDYQSVEQFMLEKASVPCKDLENLAQRYADSVLDHTPFDRSELDSLCSELDEPVRLEYFLTQFQEAVRARFLGGNCSTSVVSTLLEISGSFAQKAFIFNQNGKVLVESLYYRLREVV
jgi:DNA polymerase-3 subunit gamma/tau